MSTCANYTVAMSVDNKKLITALKNKRNAEGLSIRKLSGEIGVSFSTLARIERGEGEPDNNSLLRILNWLGAYSEEAGLELENVAQVHFRASKNVTSQTTKFLFEVAQALRKQYSLKVANKPTSNAFAFEEQGPALSLSKPEMEEMASNLRKELGVSMVQPLDALELRIEGVEITIPNEVVGISVNCLRHLTENGVEDWSAMSVPLDLDKVRWTILINNCHSTERQRVTYLEECWHILLGHKLTKIAKIGTAFGRTYESSEEHDAFYLAAATLLPDKAIHDAVEQGDSAEKIAVKFGTSPELVQYRIKRIGLWRVYKSINIRLSRN